MSFKNRIKAAITAFRNKSDSIELSQLLEFLGVDKEDYKAMSEATYYACQKVLSEAIGKMPLKLQQYTEKNGVVAARDHPLYNVCGSRPNRYMTSTSFWSTMELNRNEHGNAYAMISGAGSNTRLWILPDEQTTVWYDDAMILSNVPDVYYIYSHNGKKYSFGSESIIHLKSFNTHNGIIGIPVRETLKSTIDGNSKAQKYLNKMYDSGFTAKAVMQYTSELNDASVTKFTSMIEKYAKGEMKEEGIENIIPIPLGVSITPLTVKMTDNQFIEVKQYTSLQIASAFGIKPYQIGDYTKSSYASAEAQQLSFLVDTLLYIIKQYEEELTYKLLSPEEVNQGYHFKFNVAAILRADHKTQIETLSQAVSGFIYTPNEARAYLDKDAKEGGDQLLGNGASIPLQLAGSQYTNTEREEEFKIWMKELIGETIKRCMKAE